MNFLIKQYFFKAFDAIRQDIGIYILFIVISVGITLLNSKRSKPKNPYKNPSFHNEKQDNQFFIIQNPSDLLNDRDNKNTKQNNDKQLSHFNNENQAYPQVKQDISCQYFKDMTKCISNLLNQGISNESNGFHNNHNQHNDNNYNQQYTFQISNLFDRISLILKQCNDSQVKEQCINNCQNFPIKMKEDIKSLFSIESYTQYQDFQIKRKLSQAESAFLIIHFDENQVSQLSMESLKEISIETKNNARHYVNDTKIISYSLIGYIFNTNNNYNSYQKSNSIIFALKNDFRYSERNVIKAILYQKKKEILNRQQVSLSTPPSQAQPSNFDTPPPIIPPIQEKKQWRNGLTNMGNTCFFNSTLQMMMHCLDIVECTVPQKSKMLSNLLELKESKQEQMISKLLNLYQSLQFANQQLGVANDPVRVLSAITFNPQQNKQQIDMTIMGDKEGEIEIDISQINKCQQDYQYWNQKNIDITFLFQSVIYYGSWCTQCQKSTLINEEQKLLFSITSLKERSSIQGALTSTLKNSSNFSNEICQNCLNSLLPINGLIKLPQFLYINLDEKLMGVVTINPKLQLHDELRDCDVTYDCVGFICHPTYHYTYVRKEKNGNYIHFNDSYVSESKYHDDYNYPIKGVLYSCSKNQDPSINKNFRRKD